MTAADDVLFAPIDGSDEPWRQQCRHFISQLEEIRRERKKRPAGAMLLEKLLERFYVHGQVTFWIVDPVEGKFEFDFNGKVFLMENGFAALSEPDGEPVIEWNLFPNEENSMCFTFWEERDADIYESQIMSS